MLGGEPSASCGEVRIAAENDGSAVPAADRATAILPYSVAQANGVVADPRDGVRIGAIDGSSPVTGPDPDGHYAPDATVIASFPGARTVYNVLDTRLPSYGQALRVVGSDSSGPGFCARAAPR